MHRIRTAFTHHPLTLALALLAASPAAAQTSSQKAAVPLNAAVQAAPARITLSWTSLPGTTSITIYRKAADAASWGSAIASPAATDLSYADNSVAAGTLYEYKVVRVAAGVTGTGYIASGIAVPPTDFRGRMILLVDDAFTSSLAPELATLVADLRMDGWAVTRADLPRTASVAAVKGAILSRYNADPQNTKAVFIVGHLAVPYSGNQAPDGHSEHIGAWACDGYYGELDGNWTDATVNSSSAARPQNRNVPGDGKFDQSDFPSALELQVGRVDFSDLPAFAQSETELLRAYLNKVHAYKTRQWAPQQRGLVYDNLQWVANPLAASAWRSIPPLVGNAQTSAAQQLIYQYPQLVDNQSYLWSYFSGGGQQATTNGVLTYNGAERCGTTESWAASTSSGSVFNMSFGSYFGDWDNKNNFLRAVLASGQALTNCWAGIPAWYFHHMGMGANIGYSALVTMNNTGLYVPKTDGWQGSIGRSHLALMGDPSLRLKMLVPPSNLQVSNSGGHASFSWAPAPEPVDGYHLYAIDGATGIITRITPSPVTGSSYTSPTVPFVAGKEYMVRAVKLVVEPCGSYHDLSLGASAVAASSITDCAGSTGGTALPGTPCNDGNACTINDTWNANCQCVGTPATPTATVTAASPTGLCTGGSVVLSAGTGSGYTYQWKKNGTAINGATSSTYTATAAGSYTVTVTSGGCSATSAATTVTVSAVPAATITAGGATTFCSGGNVALSASTGSGYTYQWKKNGANISGATASAYTATTAGSYTVTVTSGGCSATSAATTVAVNPAPTASITAGGPTGFCTGGSVVLSAATGTGYAYQWKKNGTAINGATASTYTATAAGSYTVTVTSGGCSATSAATTVTVSAVPAATITAGGSTTFCSGGSVALSASTGSGYTYQWKKNGAAISGATSSTYTATTAGSYTVVVTSGGCSATSAAKAVTVNAAPVVSCSSNAGARTVSVTATGGQSPYTYSWSTAPSQSTPTATVQASGTYTATVTGANGCAASCSTTITLATGASCTGIRTETQFTWGAPAKGTNASASMTARWAQAFSGPSYLTAGCGQRVVRFTTAQAVIDGLPYTGDIVLLPVGTTVNPGSSLTSTLLGHLVAAKINIRMDEVDPSFSQSAVRLKDMVIASGTFAGWTVQQLVNHADQAIGGCVSQYPLVAISTALKTLNAGYQGGTMNSGFLTCPATGIALQQESASDPFGEERVAVYPNPTRGTTTVRIPAMAEDQPMIVELYGATGARLATLFEGRAEAGVPLEMQWEASAWPAGAYICRVIAGGSLWHARVVVE